MVAATDGGLYCGLATVAAVAFRLDEETNYASTGPAVCELATRLRTKTQSVPLAESEAVESLLHMAPPGARIQVGMDARTKMMNILNFGKAGERRRLRMSGRSSMRRIEELIHAKGIQIRFEWVKSHQDMTTPLEHMEPPAILNSWADALTVEARALPPPQSIASLRPGSDPVTIRLGDGGFVDEPVWESLSRWCDKQNSQDLMLKIAKRRGSHIDVSLSGQIFMKRRAGLAVFSHLTPKEDSSLFSIRNHELWKSESADFLCQGCHQPMTDHHFAFAECCQNLPRWDSLVPELNTIASKAGIPLGLQWWRYQCRNPIGTQRGCTLHTCLGDFTCLNTIMAEVPSAVAEWSNRQPNRYAIDKVILKIQVKIAEHVTKRREILYPKNYHPL